MKKFLMRTLILMALVATGWTSASAAVDATSVSSFELGTAYSVGMFQSFSGTVTLPAGKVSVYNMPYGAFATDEEGNGRLEGKDSGYGTLICDDGTECYGQVFTYEVPAAGTYYFSNFGDWIWDTYVFGIQAEGAQAIAYTEISPAEGSTMTSTVNTSGSGYLLIYFNVPVTYSRAYIKCGEVSSSPVKPPVSGYVTNVNVMLRELIKSMYANGAFSQAGGEEFQVVIEGIQDESGNKYGEDGTLVLSYVAGPKLMSMTSSSMGSNAIDGQEFLTYWPVSGSADAAPGVFVFTFDQLMNTVIDEYSPYIEIGCGDIESENNYYYEQVYPTTVVNADGQGSLYFDLRGANRKNGFEAIGSSKAYDGARVSLKLCNVKDINGNFPEPAVDAGGNVTNVGSYSYNMSLKFVPEQTIDFEFTPANGGALGACETLQLWHNNLGVIESFDGILFAYEDATSELVPAASLTNVSEEPDEAVYNIAIPARAKTEPVVVSMSNVVAIDGYEKNISAAYNKFVITYSAPFVEGEKYAEVAADPWLIGDNSMTDADKLIHARTNYAESYPGLFMKYSIDDITDPENVKTLHASDMKRLDDGEYVGCAMNHAQPLYAGHTYAITFTAWATESACNYGQPAVGSYAVKFYGSSEAFAYSDIQFVSISPDPNAGTISADQNEFVITYDGIVKLSEYTGVPAGMGGGLKPVEYVAVNADPENGGYASEWKITVPESYMTGTALDLNVGAVDIKGLTVEGDIHSESKADYKSFSYLIYNPSTYEALSSDPADGATVTEISEITLTAPAALGINWGYTGAGIQIVNKVSEVVRTLVCSDDEAATEVFVVSDQAVDEDGNPVYDGLGNPVYSEDTHIELRLKAPITDEGGYMVVIPEAYFITGDMFDTNYTQATTISLTVGSAPSTGLKISVEPEDGAVVETIAIIHVNTSAAIYDDCPDYYMTLKRDQWTDVAEWSYSMVTNEDWHIAKVYETPYDDTTPLVGYDFYIGGLEDTPGEYTLTIPAKFFEKDGQYNDKMVVTFSIAASGEAVTIETSPANGAEILVGEFNEFIIYTDAEPDPSSGVAITMENNDNWDAFQEAYASDLEAIDGGYKITVTEDALKNTLGEISIAIPNGFFKLGSSKNDDTFVSIYIVEEGEVDPGEVESEFVITPDPVEEQEQGIYPETLSEIVIYNAAGLAPTYEAEDNIKVENLTTSETVKDLGPIFFTDFFPVSDGGCYVDDNTAKIVFSPALDRTEANYKLTIPAGFFKDKAGNKNDVIEVSYARSSAIADILGDSAEKFDVYYVNGVKVMSTDNAQDLRSLAPGMYIINGRKYILR